MSVASQEATGLPNRIRRYRVTTACVACRDRRVKCDRLKPACSQCARAIRPCKYASGKSKRIAFDSVTGPRPKAWSEDSWTSLLDDQLESSERASSLDAKRPSWAVGEDEEFSCPRPRRCLPRTNIIPISSLNEGYINWLEAHLPSKIICQTFFENFLQDVLPFVPICHESALKQVYTEFWTNLSSQTSVELLILVLAVLCTGSYNVPCPDMRSSATLLQLYNNVAQHMDLASFYIRNEIAALQLLQAHLIMNTYRANHLAPFAAFGFLPQAIRFGQSLRLHVAGTRPGNDQSSPDSPIKRAHAEDRRRTWYHLLFLDVESVVANGLPPIIRSDGYTTNLPSIIHDHDLSLTPDQQPTQTISPMMVAMQGHYQWARHMQKWFERLPTHAEVSDFKGLIEQLLNLVPQKDSTENQWARTYLNMQIDRAYCMLGLRFWRLDRFSGTGCQSKIVRTARSFLQHYLTLSSLSNPHSSWFLPGLIQPLHALIILLMHLSTCTNVCSEESLSRSLLDDVFELRVSRILAGTVVAEKAMIHGEQRPQRSNTRYSMLVELRAKVWKKLGWDKDGKGKDPWGGMLIDEDEDTDEVAAEEVECQDLGMDGILIGAKGEVQENQEPSAACEDSQLDNFGDPGEDPLDMFHWDKWEGLAEGLFVS
ncbi:hypothetical protein EG329_004676 [Mollisiaceae sp. DMI_Dod_QoI]|nr:hypothetical protein EG329_004676 [Helotiales sp. DMI_Dod_QoI]